MKIVLVFNMSESHIHARGQWLNWNLKEALNKIHLSRKSVYCLILQKQPPEVFSKKRFA